MKEDWASLPRLSKLASVLYSAQVPKERLAEMQKIAAREGKQIRGSTLLSNAERGAVSQLGGVAVARPEIKQKGQ